MEEGPETRPSSNSHGNRQRAVGVAAAGASKEDAGIASDTRTSFYSNRGATATATAEEASGSSFELAGPNLTAEGQPPKHGDRNDYSGYPMMRQSDNRRYYDSSNNNRNSRSSSSSNNNDSEHHRHQEGGTFHRDHRRDYRPREEHYSSYNHVPGYMNRRNEGQYHHHHHRRFPHRSDGHMNGREWRGYDNYSGSQQRWQGGEFNNNYHGDYNNGYRYEHDNRQGRGGRDQTSQNQGVGFDCGVGGGGGSKRYPSPGWEQPVRRNYRRHNSSNNNGNRWNDYGNVPEPPKIAYIPPSSNLDSQQRQQPSMLLLVGLPGSGKSTFATALTTAMPYKYVRVNQDTLGHRRNCEKLARESLQEFKSPIIDRCNFDAVQRQHFLDIGREAEVHVDCIVFDYHIQGCIHRCQRRENHETIPPDQARQILQRIGNQWDPPRGSELSHFRSVRTITNFTQANALIQELLTTAQS